MKNNKVTLKRSLSLPLITFYGLGNIVGAGIYVLIGKVAGEAGYFTPLAFFIASIIAAISAFSYAELSARYPVSAGEAVYLYEGFGIQKLSMVVGLMIAFAGIVSAAAIAHGFAGYMRVFFDIPSWLIIILLLFVLGLLAVWGISQSVRVAATLTVLEIIGLLLIIFVGFDQFIEPIHGLERARVLQPESAAEGFTVMGVLSGAFLAFYAYIGFENMVNVAEEVKRPQRAMPRAILLCVIISTLLYSGVALVSVSVLTPEELSLSTAPLAAVYSKATGETPVVITMIGIFAVINGCLIQLIMSSRLLYGMAARNWLPHFLSRIYPVTRTPVNSTIVSTGLVVFFALMLEMVSLAEITSYLVLMVFALVNLALIKIKQRVPDPEGVSTFPLWLPRLGFLSAMMFLSVELLSNII